MKNRLPCGAQLRISPELVAGVGVAIVAGEVARRHLQTQAVSRLEHMARGPQVNGVLVYLLRREQSRGGEGLTEAGADHSFDDVLRVAVRAHIDELGGEVSVRRGGSGKKFERDRTSDLR